MREKTTSSETCLPMQKVFTDRSNCAGGSLAMAMSTTAFLDREIIGLFPGAIRDRFIPARPLSHEGRHRRMTLRAGSPPLEG